MSTTQPLQPHAAKPARMLYRILLERFESLGEVWVAYDDETEGFIFKIEATKILLRRSFRVTRYNEGDADKLIDSPAEMVKLPAIVWISGPSDEVCRNVTTQSFRPQGDTSKYPEPPRDATRLHEQSGPAFADDSEIRQLIIWLREAEIV